MCSPFGPKHDGREVLNMSKPFSSRPRVKMNRRLAKTMSKENVAVMGDLFRDEFGEQIANHADFMRKRTCLRNRDKLPKEKGRSSPFSLVLRERFDEMDRNRAYFRWTKPYEIVVVNKQ